MGDSDRYGGSLMVYTKEQEWLNSSCRWKRMYCFISRRSLKQAREVCSRSTRSHSKNAQKAFPGTTRKECHVTVRILLSTRSHCGICFCRRMFASVTPEECFEIRWTYCGISFPQEALETRSHRRLGSLLSRTQQEASSRLLWLLPLDYSSNSIPVHRK